MLTRRHWLAAAIALTTTPSLAATPTGQADLSGELDGVREKAGLPAFAAAAIVKGEIVAAGVAGVRAIGRTEKATLDDRFHIGSDTKAFTATLAGMMVEAGKLKWTTTLGEILGSDAPGINPQFAAVTLEQLLSHASGIPSDNDAIYTLYFSNDGFQYNMPAQRLRLLNAWKTNAPATPPGAQFHYSNLGVTFAGAMIEKVAGVSWEELITTRIFAPLGLKSAGLGPQATTGRWDAPVGHQVDDKGAATPMPWGPAADVPPVIGPAGVAHMSVLDFARWAGWNAGGGKRGPALVTPETLAAIHRPRISTGKLPNAAPGTPQEGRYALCWGVLDFAWAKRPLLQHSGSNSMNLAKILVDPEADIGIVVMTNFPGKAADDATYAMMERLYRRYAGP